MTSTEELHKTIDTTPMPRSIEQQIKGHKLTPMLEQFVAAKRDAPDDAILLFRMGDFYELFFDDAVIAADALSLTLTSRDKDSDTPVPMAGVPFHAADGYIQRLLNAGFSVAICDQVEDPKLARGIVRREITQVITPGTICQPSALEPSSSHYLGHIVYAEPGYARLILMDVLVGEILSTYISIQELPEEIERMQVRELVVTPEDAAQSKERLQKRCPIRSWHPPELDAHTNDDDAAWFQQTFQRSAFDAYEASGVRYLTAFVARMQRRSIDHLQVPKIYSIADYVVVDSSTLRNLEIFQTYDGNKKGSLFHVINKTKTALGARTLRSWIRFPLKNKPAIDERSNAVAFFVQHRRLREDIQKGLMPIRDLERLLGRVCLDTARPYDIGLIRQSLKAWSAIHALFDGAAHDSVGISALASAFQPYAHTQEASDLVDTLNTALQEDLPLHTRDGRMMAHGYDTELDTLLDLSDNAHLAMRSMESRERERTGISTLKVKYNKVFGYFIEVSKAHRDKVPEDYERKQTLVNAERFITDELKEFEHKVLSADAQRIALEQSLFVSLLEKIKDKVPMLRALASWIGRIDTLCSLAQTADENDYCQAVMDDASILELVASRHPVVEVMMSASEAFVPNDIQLDAQGQQVLLITGPNMAGKSTVMRQVAIACLMAHVGSFVPAERASIGLCDRIFTRVGASDNISRGQSTFMVEMSETASILHKATPQSLVIVDEIGRGTSTSDGHALAHAVAEHLVTQVKARTLFATHFHELTELEAQHGSLCNITLGVQERRGDLVFSRELLKGAANRSYGIQVAKLAGLPDQVIQRAQSLLDTKQEEINTQTSATRASSLKSSDKSERQNNSQLPLFTEPKNACNAKERAALDTLRGLEINAMTPLEALNALQSLQDLSTPQQARPS